MKIIGSLLVFFILFPGGLTALYEESGYYAVITGDQSVEVNSTEKYELKVYDKDENIIKEESFKKKFTNIGDVLIEKKTSFTDNQGKSHTLIGNLKVEVVSSLSEANNLDIIFTDPIKNDATPTSKLIQNINQAKSSVEVVAYIIGNQDVVDALIAAADRLGPENVRIVVEKDYYDKPEYQKYYKALESQGIKIVTDNGDGLVHNKFFVIDKEKVITGSTNFSNSDLYDNNNNMVFLNSKEVAEAYHQEFVEMFEEQKFGKSKDQSTNNSFTITVGDPNKVSINSDNIETLMLLPGIDKSLAQRIIDYRKQNGDFTTPSDIKKVSGIGEKTYNKIKDYIVCEATPTREVGVEVYFSPTDHYRNKIVELIDNAKTEINFAVFTFTDDKIKDALIRAHERGVKINGVFDAWQTDNPNSAYYEMKKQGIDVTKDTNNGLLHHKFMVIDGETTITGSYNWTYSAETKNDENGLIIKDNQISQEYNKEFQNLS
ncbi:MAG: phospholipase D-like domain-containing protein [Candidatus Hydrogenedentota bacterium]